MISELFHSLNFSFLILIFLIFLSFFFLIRGILLYLANPERRSPAAVKEEAQGNGGSGVAPQR